MKNINRIAIIGNAGSGKSTLALRLQSILKLPVYHLDQYFWKPNWGRPDPDDYKRVHDQLCEQEQWIMDGMNLRVLEFRVQRADIVIFLDVPRYLSFWRIFKRTIKYYGKQTPSAAKDCRERINFEFLKFLKWVWDFKARYPVAITEMLEKYKKDKEIYVLRSAQDVDLFICKRFTL